MTDEVGGGMARGVAGAGRELRVELREGDPTIRRAIARGCAALGVQVVERGEARRGRDALLWSREPGEPTAPLAREAATTRVLVLVDGPTPIEVSRLVSAGAASVLDRSSDPATIAHGALSVARGYLVLPSDQCGSLVRPLLPEPLSDDELSWLRSLAAGDDVLAVASAAGCSEREMYRRLRAVYTKLKVVGRLGALDLLRRADLV
ncbi:MAG: Response regulator receiver protein [Actinomycetia bacterium]|nr:Response regulator receiver protein [Actinomycetes bacterium]